MCQLSKESKGTKSWIVKGNDDIEPEVVNIYRNVESEKKELNQGEKIDWSCRNLENVKWPKPRSRKKKGDRYRNAERNNLILGTKNNRSYRNVSNLKRNLPSRENITTVKLKKEIRELK